MAFRKLRWLPLSGPRRADLLSELRNERIQEVNFMPDNARSASLVLGIVSWSLFRHSIFSG